MVCRKMTGKAGNKTEWDNAGRKDPRAHGKQSQFAQTQLLNLAKHIQGLSKVG